MKCIKLDNQREREREVVNEIEIARMVDHPNIIRLFNYFLYKDFYILILPYYPDLSVLDFLQQVYNEGIPESIASRMFFQMLGAVRYLHSIGICYNDIKCQKFLVSNQNPNHPQVVLTNSSLSIILQDNETSTNFCGTLQYMAPEIVKRIPYNHKVDVWSLGITLFVMLSGRFPFPNHHHNPKEMFKRIANGQMNYDILFDKEISENAIDLIHQMCNVDPLSRISIHDALNHPWIIEHIQGLNPVNLAEVIEINEDDATVL